jgi:hypothetical protein
MALMAICPKCGVENSPMNTACDMCKAPLGAQLAEGAGTPIKPSVWLGIASAITLGFALLAWIFKLPPVAFGLAMFYGPMIASLLARESIVPSAGLGGVVGLVALIVLGLVLEGEAMRAVLTAAMGGTPQITEDGVTTGTSLPSAFIFGSLVLAAVFAPISLVGASVGEHLGQSRRRGARKAAAPTQPLTDAEIARVEL